MWCLEHESYEEFQSKAEDTVEVTSDHPEELFSGWTSEESSAARAKYLIQSLPEELR